VILLLSNERDLTTDYIVLQLQKRGVPYFRLNSERLASGKLIARPCIGRFGWRVEFDDSGLDLADVAAAYFRRPGSPILPNIVDDHAERRYCEQEWGSVLRSIYSALGDRWLNAPARIAVAEDKPLQLARAADVGLRIPETLITNDPAAAKHFIAGGASIAKPLYSGLLEDDSGEARDRVIFTNRISEPEAFPAAAYEAAPVILQREIPKALDIRATVVGERVFAAGIDSQIREQTSVDWRRGSDPSLPHSVHELPADMARMCVSLVERLGLRFAAIDLVLDQEGVYWFLEANPNGQWAWIESRTGLTISSAIVDELLAIASTIDRGRMP
jgi:glutathione synthase/RimK-type ligase-like ATP-grasp enzyme